MMQVENAFPGVHLPTGGGGGGGGGGDSVEGGEEGDVPEEVPTRWTDQTALNIADDGGTEDERTAAAEAELRLSLLLLLAFQLRSLSSRKSRSPPPRPRPRDVASPSPSPPCPLALACSLVVCFLPRWLRARAEQNTWQNFLIVNLISITDRGGYRRRIFPDLVSKELNVWCSAHEQLL